MKKIIHIVGARPQFIKLAPLYHALSGGYQQSILHTGQHYDAQMSDFFFRDLEIPSSEFNLNIGSGTQGEQTGHMLIGIEKALLTYMPDLVIIYGDTNSTLAGALAAAKLSLPSVHIEACLRSFNRSMPEEINRIVADHTADYLFCPTLQALANSEAEGLSAKALLTGDIMVDSIKEGVRKAGIHSRILHELSILPHSYNLLTLHRPYNVDDCDNLFSILSELNLLGEKIIFPVHPRTRNILNNAKRDFSSLQNIQYINPVGYLDFVMLEQNSIRIVTDSGGIQKEAYILHKPCITLRTETEWVETVQEGWNLLISPHSGGYHDTILDFDVPPSQNDVFGVNVALKMTEAISRIL